MFPGHNEEEIAGSVTTGEDEYKPVTGNILPDDYIIPGGECIGVKLAVKDVLIVGLEEMTNTKGEKVNPGLSAGLQIGDTIIAINGIEVHNAADVSKLLSEMDDKAITIKIGRKGEIIYVMISPVKDINDGKNKIGVWVKEQTAGIGTLTYYHPSDNTFAALGHGITEIESGSILKVENGLLLDAQILSIKEGKKGEPGELRGVFYESDQPLGQLLRNNEYGIFGVAYDNLKKKSDVKKAVQIADIDEIQTGAATILTTLEKTDVQSYKINIESVSKKNINSTKNMIIRVTDKELIDRCGGIIQGMSGSPIMQNGKIIGAVTHVLINDPTRGYGIFIKNMKEAADNMDLSNAP